LGEFGLCPPGNNSAESKAIALLLSLNKLDFHNVEKVRKVLKDLSNDFPMAEDITEERVFIHRDLGDQDMEAVWLIPPGVDRTTSPVILYLHGGAYVAGGIFSHSHFVAEFARRSKAIGFLIEYSLGPERPLPQGVHDSVRAYKWLLEKSISNKRIVIAGDSAGGGLTALTLISLRDENVELPSAGILISPWTDLSTSSDSYRRNKKTDAMLQSIESPENHVANNAIGSRDVSLRKDPKFSPLYANLSNLPPLLIQFGSFETLEDDSVSFAEKAKQAGVKVISQRFFGMQHVFQLFYNFFEEASTALNQMADFVVQHTKLN